MFIYLFIYMKSLLMRDEKKMYWNVLVFYGSVHPISFIYLFIDSYEVSSHERCHTGIEIL